MERLIFLKDAAILVPLTVGVVLPFKISNASHIQRLAQKEVVSLFMSVFFHF